MGKTRYSLQDLAIEVLNMEKRWLTPQEVWEIALSEGLNSKLSESPRGGGNLKDSNASYPPALGSDLYGGLKRRECNIDKSASKPMKFRIADGSVSASAGSPASADSYSPKLEKDMHPLLSHVLGKGGLFPDTEIYTLTIGHEKSNRDGLGKWSHPDMVGVDLRQPGHDSWLALGKEIASSEMIRLYSFEIKRAVNKSNYREAFFQAVSNSSWANEGYLVSGSIDDSSDLWADLRRLSASFGIGIILLNGTDLKWSEVKIPARQTALDWGTIKHLAEKNGDFSKFLKQIKRDFAAGEVSEKYYDSTEYPPKSAKRDS